MDHFLGNKLCRRLVAAVSDESGTCSPAGSSSYPQLARAAGCQLKRRVCEHERVTARTYISDDVVVCILEDILSGGWQKLIAAGSSSELIDGRVAFRSDREDAFSAAGPAAATSHRLQ